MLIWFNNLLVTKIFFLRLKLNSDAFLLNK